jgi:RalA-binding protein 1
MSTEISYLKAKFETGIFKSRVIETDLDFDIIHQEEIFDTNAVAGLLKLYLRELPAPLFPENEKPDDSKSGIEKYRIALSKIPELDFVLLRTIFGHLTLIASHSSVNKMSSHNLSIIFSPTLQLSPLAFSVLLNDYGTVFNREDVRSPRL